MKKCIIKKAENTSLLFKEIWSSDNLIINWCEMLFDTENKIQVQEEGEFMELHFQFNGLSKTLSNGKEIIMTPNSQGIFYVNNFTGEHLHYKDNFNPYSFFEIKLEREAIKKFFPEELWYELGFIRDLFYGTTFSTNSIKPVSPQMRGVIYNMCNCPFKGIMRKMYLEAQITELFLLQVESHKPLKNNNIKKKDIDKLIATKEFIDKNYRKRIRIIDLAKIVGTNQQLLRTGFKALFGTTIFGYYNDLRMEWANHLLVNKDKLVAEVADEIGYKNPQHFTVAFKKKFGVLPKDLKSN